MVEESFICRRGRRKRKIGASNLEGVLYVMRRRQVSRGKLNLVNCEGITNSKGFISLKAAFTTWSPSLPSLPRKLEQFSILKSDRPPLEPSSVLNRRVERIELET